MDFPLYSSFSQTDHFAEHKVEEQTQQQKLPRQDSFGSQDSETPVMHIRSSPRKLTLSAFRRPEQTVRLTRADPRRKFEDFYNMHALGCRVLGHGAFSTVRLAVRRSDGAKVAVKSIAKHEALRAQRLRRGGRRYLEEWEILRRMNYHPNIISLLDLLETDEEIQLVMEYCPGGELFDAIQRKRHRIPTLRRGQYAEPQAARITRQIALALADLHAKGIVHRDVKPENILLMDDDEKGRINVKLCDFGVARSITSDTDTPLDGGRGDYSPPTPGRKRAYSMIGSNFYIAPEVNCGSSYDTAVDVYSLGVTLYILLCGFPPVFSGSDESQVIFPHAYWKHVSSSAKDLVVRMLQPDTNMRISARGASQHAWIREHSEPFSPMRAKSLLSPTDENSVTNLDAVRSRLESGGTTSSDRKPSYKRPRMERRASSCLMALADLYRGVASPTRTTRDLQSSPKSMRVNVALSF